MLLLFSLSFAYGKTAQLKNKQVLIYKSPSITYEIKQMQGGNVNLIVKQNGKITANINQRTMTSLSDNLIKIAKQVCSYKLRPDSVTVSLPVFLSATWKTEKLCK